MSLAFTDTETTGLDPDEHDVWEIAIILRTPDGAETEYLWQHRIPELTLRHADPEALRISRYRERMAVPRTEWAADMLNRRPDDTPTPISLRDLRETLTGLLKGVVMVGSNPAFDAGFLRVFLDDAPWHYRTVDVATLAAGHRYGLAAALSGVGGDAGESDYPRVPYSSRDLSSWFGVEPPGPGVAHTALGDARWARDVYDAVTGGRAVRSVEGVA